jgi:5-oxoprolinase (ATP-hydrolysing)
VFLVSSWSCYILDISQINQFLASDGKEAMSVEEIAMGFVKVANENMCRPIRALTQAKGYDTSRHVLACFGGAGGQHACAVARSLGMSTVYIHKYVCFHFICHIYNLAGFTDRIYWWNQKWFTGCVRQLLRCSRYAGILSAYGIALADVVHEAQETCSKVYSRGETWKTAKKRLYFL